MAINRKVIKKEDLEGLIKKGLNYQQIANELKVSIYIVKRSAIDHGVFTGKEYSLICDGCGKQFSHFVKNYKFCSNQCKHRKQLVWNRGRTKHNDSRIMKNSIVMEGNERYSKSEKLVQIHLKNSKIHTEYSSKSNIEKNFLLSLDNNPRFLKVERASFSIPYLDPFSRKTRHYNPDFIVSWKDGPKWVVEIKGSLHLNEIEKIEAGQKYCVENGMRYKLITTGLVKYNLWDRFHHQTYNFVVPSKEYVMMSNSVGMSLFSKSHSRRVGALIVSEDYEHLLSYGYNGDERGGIDIPESYEPGCSGFIHAEENALIKLRDKHPSVMFLTDSPCEMCAKKIINAKTIKEVYYLREYRGLDGIGLLISNNIPTYKFQLLDDRLKPLLDDEAYKAFVPAGFPLDE